MITVEEIEAKKSAKGGWTRQQLAEWGVPWPPPHGWRQMLIAGQDIPQVIIEGSPIRPEDSAHNLLQKVVMAVINRGHASDLYEYPDVLAYFGSQIPDATDLK